MKNLFFNVPARRNFLKSNAAELRHIVDEFTRVALAFPGIFFSLTSNGQEIFHLEPGSLKQRVIQLLGNSYNAKLVAVKEETDYMNIYGFVGKPETAKKTRGDQYFFVNSRFIRSPYLNHAVMQAYQEMIAADSYPLYVLFIDLDPAQVDVNVHPTKQEIKFEDEKIVYAFVQAAVKHALAQFSVMPTLDFELDAAIQQLPAIQQPFTEKKQEAVASTSLFRGFTQKHQAHFIEKTGYSQQEMVSHQPPVPEIDEVFQVLNNYIVVNHYNKFLLVHQQAAHERILYEQLARASREKPIAAQKSMFPVTIDFSPADAAIIEEILPDLEQLGYLLEPFGKHTYVLQGIPADVGQGNEKRMIDFLLESYKNFESEVKLPAREKLVRAAARQQSVKSGAQLSVKEMKSIVNSLFACQQPNITPDGYPTYLEFKQEHLQKLFGK